MQNRVCIAAYKTTNMSVILSDFLASVQLRTAAKVSLRRNHEISLFSSTVTAASEGHTALWLLTRPSDSRDCERHCWGWREDHVCLDAVRGDWVLRLHRAQVSLHPQNQLRLLPDLAQCHQLCKQPLGHRPANAQHASQEAGTQKVNTAKSQRLGHLFLINSLSNLSLFTQKKWHFVHHYTKSTA